jgi:hypothetical protein
MNAIAPFGRVPFAENAPTGPVFVAHYAIGKSRIVAKTVRHRHTGHDFQQFPGIAPLQKDVVDHLCV